MSQVNSRKEDPVRINLTVNEHLICRSINHAGAELIGRSVSDCLNMPLTGLFPGKDNRKIISSIESLFITGIDSYQHIKFQVGKELKKYEIIISPVRDLFDEIVLARITASEVLDLEKIYMKASEAEVLRKMSAALAAVAHEVNNPLSVVMGYAEILLLDRSINPDITDKVKAIRSHAERIKELIIQMTDISQVKTKNYILGSEILDIRKSSDPDAVKKKSILVLDTIENEGLNFASVLMSDGYHANFIKETDLINDLVSKYSFPVIILDIEFFRGNLIRKMRDIHDLYIKEKVLVPETILIYDNDIHEDAKSIKETDINKTLKRPVQDRKLIEAVRAAEMRYCNKAVRTT